MNCVHCDSPVPESSNFCLTCGADLSNSGEGAAPRTDTGALIRRLSQSVGGRYRVTKAIGRGGMGAVFLAEDTTLERPVAIKALLPEAGGSNLVERFEREARTAAKLDHPNIIPIYSVESDGDLHFFVMKFVDGEPLDDVLRAGTVSLDQTQTLLWEAAMALAHAHKRGVVHRDIKPGNILIERDGRVLLADFGISKAMQSATQLTGTGQVIGTPHYMSPEQAKGEEIDGRSDQYSLAIMGYQMIAGRLPFADEAIHTVIFKHVASDPKPLMELRPDTPPYLATAIHRALAKHPDDRFADMEQFAEAVFPGRKRSGSIEAIAVTTSEQRRSHLSVVPTEIADSSDAKTLATPVPAATSAERPPKKRRRGAALFAAVILLGGLGGGYYAWDQGLLGGADGSGTAADPQTLAAEPTTPAPAPVPGDSQPDAAEAPEPPAAPPRTPPAAVDDPPEAADSGRAATGGTSTADETGGRSAGANRRQAAERLAMREVRLNAIPFATVFIDDVEIGLTPVNGHQVRVGRRVFRIENPRCQTQVDTIPVTPGLRPFRRVWRLTCSDR